MGTRFLAVSLCLALAFAGSVCQAADWTDRLTINGFGDWSYGQMSGENSFVSATPEGAWDFVDFSLSLRASLSETVSAAVQLNWNTSEQLLGEEEEEDTVGLELAFVAWDVTPNTTLRFGRARMPFGNYSEYLHAGVVRPFVYLPQSIYGASQLVSQSFDGLGLTGGVEFESGWSLGYDAFAGEIDFPRLEPHECLEEAEEGEIIDGCGEEAELGDTVGGRLLLSTPGGLRFGGSFYTGDQASLDADDDESQRLDVFGVQADYESNHFQVRAEWARTENDGENEVVNAGYLEVVYRLTEQWQLAVRYDMLEQTLDDEEEDELAEVFEDYQTLLEHDELAFGINYWVNPNFVLKASFHRIEGNHLSLPEDFLEDATEGELELETESDMFLLGASFTF